MRQSPQKSVNSCEKKCKPPVAPKPNIQWKNTHNPPHVAQGKIFYIGPPSVLVPIQATTKERIIPIREQLPRSTNGTALLPEFKHVTVKERICNYQSPSSFIWKSSNTADNRESLAQNVNQVALNATCKDQKVLAANATKNELLLQKVNGTNPKTICDQDGPYAVPVSGITVNQSVIHEDNDNSFVLHNNGNRKDVSGNATRISVNGIVTDLCNPSLSTYVLGGFKTPNEGFHSVHYNQPIRETLPCHASMTQPKFPCDKTQLEIVSGQEKSTTLPNLTSKVVTTLSSESAATSPASKPHLQKSKAFDLEDANCDKRLHRGISRATDNVSLVSKARSELAQGIFDVIDTGVENTCPSFFIETPTLTFTLPDLSVYADDFRSFLEKDLIETSTLVSLESGGRLNWWGAIGASRRLWPLATTGDGNCLLHAASLGMWGFHDRLLTLRKSLHEFLTSSPYSMALWRRWRWQLSMQNRKTGLVYSTTEWDEEWSNVLKLASSTPRSGGLSSSTVNLTQNTSSLSQGKLNDDLSGNVYESLEEIHVLALAHILKRPVIVVADTTLKDVNGAPFAPIPFGGIYLPLEYSPAQCQRSPLILAYDAAHFSALVVMETSESLPAVIPVTDCHHELLPVQFVVDPGDDFAWNRHEYDQIFIGKLTINTHDRKGLLAEYLDMKEVAIPPSYLETAAKNLPCDENDCLATFISDNENLEKKLSESSYDSDDGPGSDPGVSRGKKQMLTVVKQFGSIGRSMSKKIKKNFNNLSNLSRNGSFKRKNIRSANKILVSTKQNFILAAQIYIGKRYEYQEEMIINYLNNAKIRFRNEPSFEKTSYEKTEAAPCISSGCTLYGTPSTSYMCSNCYNKQRDEEQKEYPIVQTDYRPYGAGRSKFYADLDEISVRNASKIPTESMVGPRDRTLFLSNSTFYNDTMGIPSYNLRRNDSKPGRPVKTSPSKASRTTTGGLATSSTKESLSPVSIVGSGLWCRRVGCDFYGSANLDGYCSKCHTKLTTKDVNQVKIAHI